MTTRSGYESGPRDLAVLVLLGHVGGAALLGIPALFFSSTLALWGAMVGGVLGGLAGIALGAVVVRMGGATDRATPGPRRPWQAIGAGVLASVALAGASVAIALDASGFVEVSPCRGLGVGLGEYLRTVETLVPVQSTCHYAGGVLSLVPPALVAALSAVAIAGAAAIARGLWSLRAVPAETRVRWLAAPVAAFLALDGVLGGVALLAPAGVGA